MAIVLKYGNPGPILGAGFAAGRGHRQNEERQDNLKLWQQQQAQNFQAGQNAADRSQRTGLALLGMEQQAQQAQMDRNFRAGQQFDALSFQGAQADLNRTFRAGEQGQEFKFREGQQDKEFKFRGDQATQQDQFLHDENVMMGLRRGELELPPAVQSQLQKLDAGLVDAMKLGPEQQQEFRRKYDSEKSALLRMAQPKTQSPAAEWGRDTVYVDPQGKGFDQPGDGRTPYNSRTGKPVFEPKEDDLAKNRNDAVMKRYEKLLTEQDENGKPLYSDENKALQAAIDQQDKIERGRQRLLGGQQPAVQAQNTAASSGGLPPGAPLMNDDLKIRGGQQGSTVAGTGEFVANAPATYEQGGKVYEQRGGKWVRVK